MRTAIVTGATGNLGSAVAERLLAGGYTVVGTSGRNAADTGKPSFTLATADLTDEHAAEGFVNRVIVQNGRIDVAVLTVGGFAMGTFADTSVDELRTQIRVNFETAWNVARPLFRQMLKQEYGRIFLISSVPGSDISKGSYAVAYALSKSMLHDLAAIINHEAGKLNIVCSIVIPSTIDTPQNRAAMPDADTSAWVSPAVIADAIAWYAGPEADKIRQPIISITG